MSKLFISLPSRLLSIVIVFLSLQGFSHKPQGVSSVGVVSFNQDGAQRPTTWMTYNATVRLPGDSTICVRFNIGVFRLLTAVIYLLATHDYDEDPISFEVYFEKIRTKYGGYGRFYPLPANLATNKWYHYCQVRDKTTGEGRIYLDGEVVVRESVTFEEDTFSRNVILGQDEFKTPYSLSGQVSQVNAWSRVLSQQEIRRIAECEVNLEGDAITWSGDWYLNEVEREERPLEEMCLSVVKGDVTVPLPLLRFPDAVLLCRGLGGYISVPKNNREILREISFFQGIEECDRQWAGLSDAAHEGQWANPFSGEVKNKSAIFFRANNPDGDKYQNCLRLHAKGLEDTACPKHSCSACHTQAGTTWTLRGICEEEQRMYYFDLEPDPLAFRGYGEYKVQKFENRWLWFDSVQNLTKASITQKDEVDYPIGRRAWSIESPVCNQEFGERVLSLSSCDSNQFSCSDGSCIPFGSRCDLKFDCLDDSDESQCEIVNFPEDYRSKLPPRPRSNSALPISINVSMDTINIDTSTMLTSVSYNLKMSWFDNRLTYNNLKSLTRLNTLASDQVDMLWRPVIGFINTDEIQHTHVDQDAVTVVIRDDTNFKRDFSNSYEVEIYSGDTNHVSTTRKYSTVYTCNFDLVLYPFDIQSCFLQLKILSASSEYIIFNQTDSSVDYLGQTSLIEYGIGGIDLVVNNATQYSEARVRIELIRRYGYAMLNIYIPSLTLLTISYVTLFFRPTIFEVRVMTALTALLVLATLFTQVSTSLPKTSYFKMVDIWLLFCIILIFIIIIWHTVIDVYVDYDKVIDSTIPRQNSEIFENIKIFRIKPMSGNEEDNDDAKSIVKMSSKEKKVKMARTLILLLFISKTFTFILFAIFNIAYWGTLSAESGLVYNKIYQRQ
ncbi:uncharacterized protein LOC143035535 [Oratosquilla oratoria]|uniref:uncharacterized protein LOC143035535 n=1 Tax=Oratosquilla oratoria TaxID=337810 RepID=UPI003F7634EC